MKNTILRIEDETTKRMEISSEIYMASVYALIKSGKELTYDNLMNLSLVDLIKYSNQA